MRRLAVLALLLLAACLTIGTYKGPPSICSRTNLLSVRVEFVLQDDWHPTRHTQWVGNADPGGHVCAVWTLPGDKGRWGYIVQGRDTTWDLWFQAWALKR